MSKTNFSVQEMELLVNLVEKYKHFLNCKITNAVFNKKKEEAWDSLTTDFNADSLYERLAAMGALIEPLPCRFDYDYVYETAVSSGTQGKCKWIDYYFYLAKMQALPFHAFFPTINNGNKIE
ncbi:hypothetical protein TNCT_151521 [Trichonephila clavata]|uniref:Regulatory protein zeste n=1 Tax=Trichonephila clavata TaxID=2740835 RepID=A0A8X6KF76_TRICU|nr:hypothetical protein TNCT_151521 [Trichonephila clavata]